MLRKLQNYFRKFNAIYNSKLFLLPYLHNFAAIMLCGRVFAKTSSLTARQLRHEMIHVFQYIECTVLAVFLVLLNGLVNGFAFGNILFVLLFYYILYLMEWLISMIVQILADRKINKEDLQNLNGYSKIAYYASAMEMEAYDNEGNVGYLDNRKYFSFLWYYGSITKPGIKYTIKGFYTKVFK